MMKPVSGKRRIIGKVKKSRPSFAHTQSPEGESSNSGLWLKILAGICLIALIGGIRACVNDAQKTEAVRQQTTARYDVTPTAGERPQQPKIRPSLRRTSVLPTRPKAPVAEPDTSDQAEAENEPAPTSTVTDVAPEQPKETKKVVFTDSTRIRTRPDGTIEVPRTFSYSGAGLKKPYWIYDKQLEKSGRIEYEAQAEKAARDKWKALREEALRQEATAARRGSCP